MENEQNLNTYNKVWNSKLEEKRKELWYYNEGYYQKYQLEVKKEKDNVLNNYAARLHQIEILVFMPALFVLSVVVGGLLVGGWEKFMRLCVFTEKIGLNIGVIPDFLGGLIGILVGFYFEWLFFEKLQHINKYKAFKGCLENELNCILELLSDISNKFPNEINEIELTIFDDLIKSIDNSAIIYNLPRYCIFMPRGVLYNCLADIYSYIEEYNRYFAALEKKYSDKLINDFLDTASMLYCLIELYIFSQKNKIKDKKNGKNKKC